ncbi:MAG TPA: lamin tail domain-containing protein [Candidatus Pristimantibacillus sp.]|nr:lamin tail domain-containing protein [Candidatus Pristimantibacillus sp.]
MKFRHIWLRLVSLGSAIALIFCPLAVRADDAPGVPINSVIITEVQTGAATASDEFVELYNRSSDPVDITGWQIRSVNAGGETTALLAAVASVDGQSVIMPPGSYYTLRSSSVAPAGVGQVYTAGLAKTDKTLALFAADLDTCQMEVQDAVAWASAAASATQGEGTPLDSTSINTKEKLLQRKRDTASQYVDTDNNSFDFSIAAAVASTAVPSVAVGATPGADNTAVLSDGMTLPAAGVSSPLTSVTIAGCTVPSSATTPSDPAPSPDPASDSGSETISDPTAESPADPISDPLETTPDQPETVPPNAGLLAPVVTELLPDPAAPQSDEADEYAELYNPNDTVFDLSGYGLETGLTTIHHFTFADGAELSPHAYAALFSADTGLSLSNSGGQVRLLDPEGQLLGQTDPYPAAKESQAWALINGTWQWTTLPTPNAPNMASPPQTAKVASVSTKAKPKAKATTTVAAKPKTAKVKTSGKPAVNDTVQNLAAVAPRDPLHPGVLALIGVSAVLYGAYEYRRDVANKFHQFRSNRAARAALRRGPKGG